MPERLTSEVTITPPLAVLAGADATTPSGTSGAPRGGTSITNVGRVLASSTAASVVALPLGLLTVPLFLHRLDLTAYGVFATLSAVIALTALVEAGIGTEIVRRVAAAEGRHDVAAIRRAAHEGTTILLGLAAVAAVLGAGVAFLLPDVLFGDIDAHLRAQVPYLTLAVTAMFCADLVLSGWFAVLPGLQRGEWAAAAGLISLLLGTGAVVVSILAGLGVWSLVLGGGVQLATSVGVRTLGMRRVAPAVPLRLTRTSPTTARSYAGISLLVLVASVSNIVDFQFDKVVLAHYVGAAAAGTYQIGTTLALQARGLALIPVSVLMVGVAELGSGSRLDRLRRGVDQLNTALALVLLGGVVVFAPTFTALWVGPSFSQAGFAAQLLAIALVFNVFTGPAVSYCAGRGWFSLPLVGAAANATVNATLSWSLTAWLGFNGALMGSLAGNVAGFVAFNVVLNRREHTSWLRPLVVPTVFITVAALLGLDLMSRQEPSWWGFLVGGTVWVVLTGSFFLLTRRLPLDDLKSWVRLHRGARLDAPAPVAPLVVVAAAEPRHAVDAGPFGDRI